MTAPYRMAGESPVDPDPVAARQARLAEMVEILRIRDDAKHTHDALRKTVADLAETIAKVERITTITNASFNVDASKLLLVLRREWAEAVQDYAKSSERLVATQKTYDETYEALQSCARRA